MENIQVALRIRPINDKEIENNEIELWSTANNTTVTIAPEKYNELLIRKRIPTSQKISFNFSITKKKRILFNRSLMIIFSQKIIVLTKISQPKKYIKTW